MSVDGSTLGITESHIKRLDQCEVKVNITAVGDVEILFVTPGLDDILLTSDDLRDIVEFVEHHGGVTIKACDES